MNTATAHLELNDQNPDYEEFRQSCFEPFEARLEAAVDEDRFLQDIYAVASTVMEIGLSRIEGTEKDSIALLHEAWLENSPEKLEQRLIENLEGVKEDKLENLKQLEPEELLETYRRLEGRVE